MKQPDWLFAPPYNTKTITVWLVAHDFIAGPKSRELDISGLPMLKPPKALPKDLIAASNNIAANGVIDPAQYFVTTGNTTAKLKAFIEDCTTHLQCFSKSPKYVELVTRAIATASELLDTCRKIQGKATWLECLRDGQKILVRPVTGAKQGRAMATYSYVAADRRAKMIKRAINMNVEQLYLKHP